MQPRTHRGVFVAAAVFGLFALAAVIAEGRPPVHELFVRLPDGDAARIAYVGAPPDPDVIAALSTGPFAASPSSAAMISPDARAEDLDRALQGMLERELAAADAAMADPPALGRVADAGSIGPSGVCGRSVEITAAGDGAPARVVTRTWGRCAGATVPETAPQNQRATPPVVDRQV